MYEVNRSVLVLVPQEPFWAWLQSLPDAELGDLSLADLQDDANAYLIEPAEDMDDVWDELDRRLEQIFSAELADWCEDQSLWPDLHPDIFNEWFDVRLSSVLTDLAHSELQREPFLALDNREIFKN